MTLHVRLLAAVGLALLAAGVVLGLVPALSDGGGGCGSPFAPADPVARPAGCAEPLAVQRTAALTLGLLGGALLAATVAVHVTDPSGTPAERPAY